MFLSNRILLFVKKFALIFEVFFLYNIVYSLKILLFDSCVF